MSRTLVFESHSEKGIGVVISISVVTPLKNPRRDWELTAVAAILQVLQGAVSLPAYIL